jgi:hypothetical protein
VARAAAREEGGERVVKLLQRALLVGSSIESDEIDETDEAGSAAGADSDAQDGARGGRRAPVVTEIKPAAVFWPAEGYHQRYLQKGGQDASKGSAEKVRCYG